MKKLYVAEKCGYSAQQFSDILHERRYFDNASKAEKNSPNYQDITDNWYPNAKPNSHKVKDMTEYIVDGTTYRVDGKHIFLDYSKHEKEMAELFERKIGGEIYMVPRVLYPVKISTPDYIFNGFKYDLKTITGKSDNVLYNAVSKKKIQSSKFIFDITGCPLDTKKLIEQVGKLYTSKHTRFIDEIVLIKNENIILVTKRKTEI